MYSMKQEQEGKTIYEKTMMICLYCSPNDFQSNQVIPEKNLFQSGFPENQQLQHNPEEAFQTFRFGIRKAIILPCPPGSYMTL